MEKNKKLLFERMKHLNPDFVYKINESQNLDERHFDVSNMPDISAKMDIPNIGTKVYRDIEVDNDKISINSDDIKPHKKYDFVILGDGTMLIGYGHYKLSNRANTIKAAGELMLDDYGKIVYLNNESGHYEPTVENLKDIENKFREKNLLNKEYGVIHKKYNK